MAGRQDETERTLRFAETALSQIRSLKHSAIPRNYEVWYVYAAGYHAALNKAINETIAHNGQLTETDLEHIHAAHLSNVQDTDRIGARVIREIGDVMAVISEALGMTSSLGDSLKGATSNLVSGEFDRDQIKSVVAMLIRSTHSMQDINTSLNERLQNSSREISSLQNDLEAIRAESLTDPLTGLSNRKFFDQALELAIAHARESEQPLSLLMLDIDHFKSFNDTYGHLTGDQVLRLVGLSLRQSIREQSPTARYGGEEFAVVLENTALRQALDVADNIRRTVMRRELKKKSTGEVLGRITISIGVSMLRTGDDMYALIERADGCLFGAKRSGRNRVIGETDPEYLADMSAKVA